jgi:MFS family permease
MSKISDIKEAVMSFDEKVTWVEAFVFALVPAWYFTVVLGQLGATPATDIVYQRPMLIAIGISIVLTIVGSILTGIGSGITAEIMEPGSGADIGRSDERDKQIRRRGELIGYYVSSVGAVGALTLTMLEYPYFWIANALYLGFVIAALVSAVVRIFAYRRGY